MIQLEATVGETTLSGSLYERGEDPPRFTGTPDDGAPYVWLCDEFYQVDTGGSGQVLNGQEIRVAFETPFPRGFDTRKKALSVAKEHLRTQFARIGVPEADVTIEMNHTRA